MLTFEEYNKIYKTNYDKYPAYPGCIILSSGMLKFSDETACHLAGPFDGNYGEFIIQDHTNAVITYGKHKGKNLLITQEELRIEKARKLEYMVYPNMSEKRKKALMNYDDPCPTVSNPISFRIYGNDDSSWSKFYADKESAIEELELFISAEPIDFYEVIKGFKFVFTN